MSLTVRSWIDILHAEPLDLVLYAEDRAGQISEVIGCVWGHDAPGRLTLAVAGGPHDARTPATPAGRLPESERSGKSQDGFAAEALKSDDPKTSIEVPQDMTAAPTGEAEPKRVFLVATGITHEGQELYERREGWPPPLCEFETLYAASPPQPTQQQAVAVVDFCGLQQELSERQTDRGTPYSIERWTCPNCGKACSSLTLDDEWCHGDSLSISFGPEKDADGTWTRHHKCNACWLAAPPPAGQVPADSREANAALADMTVRKDAAYLERNQVVAALAKAFPSGIARTAIEGWSEDWHGCVYIDLPTGQASWHFHDSHAYLFDGLPPYTKGWDGHDTPEKYRRLAALAGETAKPGEGI